METKYDILYQYLGERAVEMKCASCGLQEWRGPEEEAAKALLPVTSIGGSEGMMLEQRHVPMVWLLCQNCGYMAFFSKKFFDQWAKGQEDAQ